MARVVGMLSLVLLVGCATSIVPAHSDVFAPIRSEADLVVYVKANAQQEAVEEALRRAGVAVTRDLQAATLVLRAKLGTTRVVGSCGHLRNVAFDLREGGEPIAVVKGRGWTEGSCKDVDMLQDVSDELARLLGASR